MERPPSSTWSDESRSFLTGDNALYVAHLYLTYLEDPVSVEHEWRQYFAAIGDGEKDVLKDLVGPSWAKRTFPQIQPDLVPPLSKGEVVPEDVQGAILNSIRAIMLIRAYRARGHMIADLDPLGLTKKEILPELDPSTYGFTEEDYDKPIFIYDVLGLSYATLRDILKRLRQTYCGTIGIEFLHIQDPERKLWLQKRVEGQGELGLGAPIQDIKLKRRILKKLTAAELFEKFLHTKYPAAKRFGLDGGESLIPGLEVMLQKSAELGLKKWCSGCPIEDVLMFSLIFSQNLIRPFSQNSKVPTPNRIKSKVQGM